MTKRKAVSLEEEQEESLGSSSQSSDLEQSLGSEVDSDDSGDDSGDSAVENEVDEFDSEELEEDNDEEQGSDSASGDSDSSDSDEGTQNDDNQNTKNARVFKKDQFANAFNAILGSRIKAHERADPILVRSKNKSKELESGKLEAKAKRALAQERKLLEDKARIKNVLEPRDNKTSQDIVEHERKLRKIAQRGVVRLFNAVTASQQQKPDDQTMIGLTKKEEKLNEMSKDKFLELIRAGGKITAD